MATIKDVAKAAKVSISTVSYALNGDPRIPEKTASMINAIAQEIGYFPSAAARNLKKRYTQTILVAIADFGGPVYHNLLDGIHHELAMSNYTMIVSTGKSSENLLKERNADGAIITDIRISDDSLRKISKNFRPIIVLDRELEEPGIYQMTIDNYRAMREMTQTIIYEGYQKIAFVHGVKDSHDNRSRYQGFQNAMRHANMEIFEEYEGNFTKESGTDIIRKLLKSKQPLPEIFVAANDEMAIGIMDGLHEAGFQIPADYGVSGFDDIELSQYVKPQLTTVRIDHFSWGKDIAATILSLLKKQPVKLQMQPGKVIIRDSF
ncbi:MAG: LacI family DNA-binding transcriptional regulator [Candidatus Izemoplasmatales bacterium]|jgi:LacI family transcriptional regulator|nr:LacI family DNA-binding transcriptional regulator [Candidatus Izemoplasmatales bacterium]MDD4988277.1 LacI family DNA-binding transcriptional regulator [Candidatus Izemoplasmatales bacterium]MDY0373119.1 LacI family DNA-binding transcriptional regulator [Candidatus Izemoplasmatales bacterium]NLF48990.1 LacI family transcriptional regulator [Acholeplasmataceae bacterium]